MTDDTIGARIKRFRGPMTQRELAERATVSKDLISKLEQGIKTSASMATLHKIARALDVDIADLVGKRYGVPSTDPDAGVVAIRRALTSVDDLLDDASDEPPVTLIEAQRAVDYAWGSYWSGRFSRLTAVLPGSIGQLRATAHSASAGEIAPAHELLARIYWVTGCTLVHLGQADPAFLAIREALKAAERGNDELLAAALRGSVSWQLLIEGRYEEAHGVALKAAATIEPRGNVPVEQLTMHGSLLLSGAVAAGRDQRTAEALSLAGESNEVAQRLGRDRKDYETLFGTSQVVMQLVDINNSAERYPEALKAARGMPRENGLTPVAQARHLLDKGAALARTGQTQKALDMLLTAERVGGEEWVKYQTLLRQVLGELLEEDRQSPLRAFARRVGVLG